VDPIARGETRLVETIRERRGDGAAALAKTGRVEGVIKDARTGQPVPGVIVAMVGTGLPPVASDPASGRFLTHDLPTGPVKLEVSKEGYRPMARELVLAAGQTATVDLALEQLARKARFLVSVQSQAKKKPVPATVHFHGPQEQQLAVEAQPAKFEAAPGKYTVTVNAAGHLAQTRDVQVSDNVEMALAFELLPEPKKSLVIVKENKIEILQQVHFASAKAQILPDSYYLLAQVVDAIIKNDIKRLRVEGHTDNRGNKKVNLQLSQSRAQAVVDYLEKAGIDRTRLEVQGFGDARPLAPNLTARGRELNRRVDFVILER
jgi:OmpA-OmpF porin, OOP family